MQRCEYKYATCVKVFPSETSQWYFYMSCAIQWNHDPDHKPWFASNAVFLKSFFMSQNCRLVDSCLKHLAHCTRVHNEKLPRLWVHVKHDKVFTSVCVLWDRLHLKRKPGWPRQESLRLLDFEPSRNKHKISNLKQMLCEPRGNYPDIPALRFRITQELLWMGGMTNVLKPMSRRHDGHVTSLAGPRTMANMWSSTFMTVRQHSVHIFISFL